MSTIQQQLAALGHTFEVDGQKWEVKEQYIIYKNWPIAIELLLVGSDGQGGGRYYQYPSLFGQLFPTKFTKSIDAPTPADACRQALAICRERVAELGKALGVGLGASLPELETINLLAMRKERRLTLRVVEEKTGVSNHYLSQLETGQIKSPSYKIVKTLLDFYNSITISQKE